MPPRPARFSSLRYGSQWLICGTRHSALTPVVKPAVPRYSLAETNRACADPESEIRLRAASRSQAAGGASTKSASWSPRALRNAGRASQRAQYAFSVGYCASRSVWRRMCSTVTISRSAAV